MRRPSILPTPLPHASTSGSRSRQSLESEERPLMVLRRRGERLIGGSGSERRSLERNDGSLGKRSGSGTAHGGTHPRGDRNALEIRRSRGLIDLPDANVIPRTG